MCQRETSVYRRERSLRIQAVRGIYKGRIQLLCDRSRLTNCESNRTPHPEKGNSEVMISAAVMPKAYVSDARL